jgi:hypothetical protein
MKIKHILIMTASAVFLQSCSENYSNGTRIGTINKFSRTGVIWKSWEGHMNLTQTGMTGSNMDFEFSIDNDNEPEGLSKIIDSAMNYGWKVELTYHETMGKNWFSNRGATDHFIKSCKVIDRGFAHILEGFGNSKTDTIHMAGMTYVGTTHGIINLTKDSLEVLKLKSQLSK